MNTPSKEAREAAAEWQGEDCPMLSAIIDSHFEPLRQRTEQAEARVKELDELYRDIRVAYKQNAEQCVKLNQELGLMKETTEWLNGATIQRERAEKAEARVKDLQKQEAESRRLFYAEQDKRQSAEFRCEELAGALREAQHLVVAWESADGEPATELLRRIDAVLAHHAAGEPEAQK